VAQSTEISSLEALVQRIVEESGRPVGFDAQAWLARWLEEPVPALGDRRPLDVLDEADGFEKVQQILLRIQTGAYS
jgi:uncharacterized protein (DUF2384 family)